MSLTLAMMLLGGTDFGLDPAWKPLADPIAGAAGGKIQCTEPDPAARTCRGMTWYSSRADGRVDVRQVSVLDNMPAYAAELRFSLDREGAALCTTIDDGYKAGFRVVSSRAPYAPINDRRIYLLFREALIEAMAGREVCGYAFARAGDPVEQGVGTVDGQLAGELMSLYSWIDPKAGWRLKAPPQG